LRSSLAAGASATYPTFGSATGINLLRSSLAASASATSPVRIVSGHAKILVDGHDGSRPADI
jgi:hypothetical protein